MKLFKLIIKVNFMHLLEYFFPDFDLADNIYETENEIHRLRHTPHRLVPGMVWVSREGREIWMNCTKCNYSEKSFKPRAKTNDD